ncbi:MAG: hypothetical protein ACOY0R_17770 [Chloroflexota bacterium]
MLRKNLTLLILAGMLAGCTPTTAPAPTLLPEELVPTIIALTADAASTATSQAFTPTLPPETPTPTLTPRPSTPRPTSTFTPQPEIPLAQIQFLSPGPMSRFVSPVQMQLLIVAGESEVVQIDLFGEDGRPLNHRIVDRMNRLLSGVYKVYKIPFEIRAAAETALLQVSTKDKQGRMRALNSLPIVLLSSGVTETTPAGNMVYERAVFLSPENGFDAQGGELDVRGRYWPYNTQPVFLELILPNGSVTGVRVLTFDNLDPQEFSTTIPFKVTERTLALLSLRQMDPVLNAPVYVYTQEVWLNP